MLNRTGNNPLHLQTPPGTSDYTMHIEERCGKQVFVG